MTLGRRHQSFIIFAVTIGGIIEWYELFLYIYWSPIIAKLFFSSDSETVALMNTLFVFFVGFLARPIGGIIFGHIGDKYGRKESFIKSIILMTLPSFAMGLVPSTQIGIYAPILLCVLRFFQGLPAGGELPGAMCYLAESAPPNKRAYTTSFSFYGPQIGVIISMIECYFFEKYLSHEDLIAWGWRLSFIIGGFLGLIGYYLRRKLKESPAFERLEKHRKVLHKPILESIKRHKKEISLGFFASMLDVVGFYMFSVFLGIYFNKVLKISISDNLLISIFTLTLSTLTLPFIGKLGDRYNIRRLLMFSAVGMMVFSYPFYLSATHSSVFFTAIFEVILMLLLNMQFALLPCLVSELFPTSTRYTCLGLSFNLCDSVIGGITPLTALYLTHHFGDVSTFVIMIIAAAIVSLITFSFIKDRQIKKIENYE